MPDLPDNPSATPARGASLGKRALAVCVIVVIYAVLMGMAGYAVILTLNSFKPSVELNDRLFMLLAAIALLAFPFSVARVYIQRKRTTGSWRMSKPEGIQAFAQCRIRQQNPSRPASWSWIVFAATWANYSARESSLPRWRRTLGWALSLILLTAFLGVTAFGVIAIGATFADDNTLTAYIVFPAVDLATLLIPALIVRAIIRRKRTIGTLRISREEVRQMGEQICAQRAESQARESEKPLRTKIISTVIMVAILTVLWIRDAVHHSQHPNETWVTPSIWTIFAAYAIWMQFRRPRRSRS